MGSLLATKWADHVTGNDTTGDGSQGNPYKSISKLVSQLKQANGEEPDGDYVEGRVVGGADRLYTGTVDFPNDENIHLLAMYDEVDWEATGANFMRVGEGTQLRSGDAIGSWYLHGNVSGAVVTTAYNVPVRVEDTRVVMASPGGGRIISNVKGVEGWNAWVKRCRFTGPIGQYGIAVGTYTDLHRIAISSEYVGEHPGAFRLVSQGASGTCYHVAADLCQQSGIVSSSPVRCCIVTRAVEGMVASYYGIQAPDSDYNIVYDNFVGGNEFGNQGAHDIIADPLFTDRAARDFTLQAGSPAINIGPDLDAWPDLAGVTTPYPAGGLVDAGAYEYYVTVEEILLKNGVLSIAGELVDHLTIAAPG